MNDIRAIQNKKCVDIEKIFDLEDDKFIQQIYLNLLNRYPDRESFNANMICLKRGVDRAKLVLDISSSKEADIKKNSAIGIKSVCLSTLMSYEGIIFIDNLYLTLFNRHIDISAIDTFLVPFELGLKSKFEIIQQLRYSEEGIKNNVEILGLDKEIKKREFIEQVPLFSFFVNIFHMLKLIFNYKNIIYNMNNSLIECHKNIYFLQNKKNHSHCFSQDHFYKNMPNNVYEIFNMIK